MKPFNLEDAKKGKPIITRAGLKARIICFDRKWNDTPLVALIKIPISVKKYDYCESINYFKINGKYDDIKEYDYPLDLFMED